MSTLFISYSTKDRELATEVFDRLTSRGYYLPFLDYHPDAGIPGGSKWEKELRWQLKVSRGLVVLCSKNWQESKWCFAELDRAKEFQKVVIPLNLDQMTLPSTISCYQSIPFQDRNEEAYNRLWRALEANDLHPSDDFFWPRDECPYPGLASFHEEHAGVFFGRKQELSHFFQKYLDPMRESGECRLIYVIGPSGSGKSSFVRAGVIPRLKFKSAGAWQVLTVFRWAELKRDGQRWGERLAQDIQRLYGTHPQAPNWDAEECTRRYAVDETSESLEQAAHRFVMDVKDLLTALNRSTTKPIIILDQFEELLVDEENIEQIRFLSFLRHCLTADDSPCRAIATVRSDFLPTIQQAPQLIPWNETTRVFRLDLLKRERLFDVVRRPAEMVDVRFENDALVNRIVDEAQTSDALPLLAFTLKRFYDTCSEDRLLTTEEYESELGGLGKCLNSVAQGVLSDETRPNGRVDPVAENALRVGFVRELVRYEEGDDEKGGKFVRRTANWSDLPSESQGLLKKMSTEAFRLVSIDHREDSSTTVEVTHEALFRQWHTLRSWLDQRRDLLSWSADIKRSQAAAGEAWSGLTQSQLAIATDWPNTRADELSETEIAWIKTAKRKSLLVRTGLGVVAALIVAAVGIAWYFQVDSSFQAQQRDFEVEKRRLAEKNEADARSLATRRTARSLIATGDSLGNAGRWKEARSYYSRAIKLLQENELSRLPALAGLSDVFVNSPIPLTVFSGHAGPVFDVAVMPDGERAISTGADGVILWSMRDGSELRRLDGHQGKVYCVAVSPDGKWAVTGGEDRSVKQWDVGTGKLLHEFPNHKAAILTVAISSDGKRIAVGSDSTQKTEFESEPGFIRVWDTDTKMQITEYSAHSGPVRSLAFTNPFERNFPVDESESEEESYKLISGGVMTWTYNMGNSEGELVLWDATSGKQSRSFGGHRYRGKDFIGQIYAVATSQPRASYAGSISNTSLLLSGSLDKTMRLWDLETGLHLHTFASHNKAVTSVCFSSRTTRALSGSEDGSAILWDLTEREIVRRFEHQGGITAVALSDDAELAVTAGRDGKVLVWNATMRRDKRLQTFHYSGSSDGEPFEALPPGAVYTVSMSPDGRIGVAGCTAFDLSGKRPVDSSYNDLLKVFDTRTGMELHSFRGDPETVYCSTVALDGKLVAYGGSDSHIRLRDIRSGQLRGTCVGHNERILSVGCSRMGKHLVSGSADRTVKLWNINDFKMVRSFAGHEAEVTSVAISDDGKVIISGGEDGSLRLWEAADATLRQRLNHGSAIKSIALSPDSKLAVSGGTDRTLKIWDVSSGKLLRTLRGHLDPIYSVVWIRGANMLASSAGDNTIRLWDIETGDELRKIEYGAGYGILSIAISDDGTKLLAGSRDTQVRVFDFSRVDDYLRFERTARDAREALSRDSNNVEAGATIGRWLAFNGFDDWARSKLESASEAGAGVSNSELGMLYLRVGELEKAERAFKSETSSSEDDLTDPDIGLLSLKSRQRENATKLVKEGVAALDRQEWQIAKDKCDAAIEVDPWSSGAFYNRGVARYWLGDKDGAVADWENVIRLETESEYATLLSSDFSDTAHYNLACVSATKAASVDDKDSLIDNAFEHLRKAFDAGFDKWSTLESDSDLDALRDDPRFKTLLDQRRE